MIPEKQKSFSESLGEKIGFFMAMIMFFSILYFVAAKFHIMPEISYWIYILLIIVAHVVYSVGKFVMKTGRS